MSNSIITAKNMVGKKEQKKLNITNIKYLTWKY